MTGAGKPQPPRPVFTVRLRAGKDRNPIITLRAALKVLLRRFGFRTLEIVEERERDGET